MDFDSKIFVAGHKGLVGSAIIRKLNSLGYKNILTVDKSVVNLTDVEGVNCFFKIKKPEYVFLSAAKVGGIGYNKEYPADFIRENLQIQTNVIDMDAKNFFSWGLLAFILSLHQCLLKKNI
jgi:GDP-L-fucose synthase